MWKSNFASSGPLLHVTVALLIIGDKEEGAIAFDRTAQREADLALSEVRIVTIAGVDGPARYGVRLAEVVHGAAQLIGAGFCDDVHEAARGTSELRVRATRHDHDLLHRVEIERKRGPLAAALLAEERIVEVGAVDRHVVVNALLSGNGELVTVGSLHDRHAWRQ